MTRTTITDKDVKHVGELTKLPLTNSEITKLVNLFNGTMAYISVLDELDTTKVQGTFQVNGLINVFTNPDLPTNELNTSEVFLNTKASIDNKFIAEAVFDRE